LRCGWQGDSACGQMQKLPARKFHRVPSEIEEARTRRTDVGTTSAHRALNAAITWVSP